MHGSECPPSKRAVIIGGGLAGMLAAAATARFATEVVVVDRYELPEAPLSRPGVPQARHGHLLWSGGANAIEAVAPGSIQRMLDAGARRISLPTGMVAFSPRGWYRRWAPTHHVISASRDLTDWAIRDTVLHHLPEHAPVLVRENTRVLGLVGSDAQVTGVRLLGDDGQEAVLEAGLVIDASGRTSRAPEWLTELGVDPTPTEVLNTGLTYASRLYRAPAETDGWPIVSIMADPRRPGPAQAGAIFPVEDDDTGPRWLVSLSGTRGGEPRPHGEGDWFREFAAGLRHPLLAELLDRGEPLAKPHCSRATENRRHRFECAGRRWPAGLVVLGDAVATFNPVYGQGMSVAAQSVDALWQELRRGGIAAPDLSRRAQRAVGRAVRTAWSLATSQDIAFTGKAKLADRLTARYSSRLSYTATGDEEVTRALTDVMALEAGPTELARPRILRAALRGPQLEALAGPPLTEEERDVLRQRVPEPA